MLPVLFCVYLFFVIRNDDTGLNLAHGHAILFGHLRQVIQPTEFVGAAHGTDLGNLVDLVVGIAVVVRGVADR